MRILILTTDAFGGHGGIAKYNRDFLTALCAYPGCTEVVALPRYLAETPGSLPERLTYVTDSAGSKLKYVVNASRLVFHDRRFDLVVCGHINLLPLANMLACWIGAPMTLIIYGIDAWERRPSRLVNRVLKHVKRTISISDITKNKFLEWTQLPAEKVSILHNAIDINRYGLGSKDPELVERYGLREKKVLMTLARLAESERYKGIDEVLEILPELLVADPTILYMVVGDGSDRRRLEEKVAALGLRSNVVFTGFVLETEKANYYRLADVFVMPGRGEGFGFVFLEAMACGIPVVASKLDGSREAVRNGELGILVDPNNHEEIKAGVLDALNKPKGIIPDGLEYFSYNNFEKRLYRIIEQIVTDDKTKRLL
ncbi:MAG: glycosyltransferase family 4 protein [Ignavibacteriaceae bacterium]